MNSNCLGSTARVLSAFLLVLVGATVVALSPQAYAAPVGIPSERPTIRPVDGLEKRTRFSFDLFTPAGALACLPYAQGEVRITSHGENQEMEIFVEGLPANSTLAVFVLQLPHFPFGLSWYQGDIETDRHGRGRASFVGVFNDETFILAPGVGAAPVLHPADAAVNPQTPPVHTFHLGLWFDSRTDAVAAGCAANQTPFNGDHTAGILVFSTANFPDGDGPLGQFGR